MWGIQECIASINHGCEYPYVLRPLFFPTLSPSTVYYVLLYLETQLKEPPWHLRGRCEGLLQEQIKIERRDGAGAVRRPTQEERTRKQHKECTHRTKTYESNAGRESVVKRSGFV